MKNHQLERPDAQLEVLVRAGDRSVVFLHGLAGHCREWLPVVHRLDPTIGIVLVDLRGHGHSWVTGREIDLGPQAHVDDVVSLIDTYVAGPVVLVGQSMGGVVATHVAHACPDLVDHLVLVEAGIAAMTEAEVAGLKRWFEDWPAQFADEAAAADFFGPDARSTPAWVEGLKSTPTGLVRRFDPAQLLETAAALAGADRSEQWKDMAVPATIIRGSNSAIGDADIANMRALRPDVSLVVIDDSGHDVHLDRPTAVAAAIASLL